MTQNTIYKTVMLGTVQVAVQKLIEKEHLLAVVSARIFIFNKQ